MKGLFKIKFVSTRKKGFRGQTGQAGHADRNPWGCVVNLITERGVGAVEYIRHDDDGPGANKQLDGKEMLALWKAVEQSNSNR
jgi:hypothetical protein